MPGWYEYVAPVDVVCVRRIEEVLPALVDVERRVNAEGLYAAGFLTYGAAAGFDRALPRGDAEFLPLLCFGLFADRRLLKTLPQAEPTHVGDWLCEESAKDYLAQVRTLRAHIGAGDTYQVNYTTRFTARGVPRRRNCSSRALVTRSPVSR